MNKKTTIMSRSQQVESPALKFLIGFVGGLCAAIFPRLMASLTLYDSSLASFSLDYLGLSALFAIMIGGVVMIMEWGVLKEPRATFMAALALPAVLSGALNTSNGAYELDKLAEKNSELSEEVRVLRNIPEESISISSISTNSGNSGKPISLASVFGINTVYAQTSVGEIEKETGFDPSIGRQQKNYIIILEKAVSEEDAIEKMARVKSKAPTAKAVKSGNQYLVIDPKFKTKSDAVLEIIKLKEKGLHPILLSIK